MQIPYNGDYSITYHHDLYSARRTQLVYIAGADCLGAANRNHTKFPNIVFEIGMKNQDSHVSQEDYGILESYLLTFIFCLILLGS